MVFEVRYRFEGLSTLFVGALEWAIPIRMREEVVLQVLLLLECLVAAFVRACELPLMALEVPIELTLRDELPVNADWTLKL